MWTHKLLSVLVLISVSQANTSHQKLISTRNEDQNPQSIHVLDDGDEISSGPQFSYIRVKEASEAPAHKDSIKPVLEYFPVSITINVDRSKVNDEEGIIQVPVGQLKQKQQIGILQARDPASETSVGGKDSIETAFISGEPVRRSQSEHVSAGFQVFGYPIGPQFSKTTSDQNVGSRKEDDGSPSSNALLEKIERVAKKLVTEYI